MWTCPDCGRSFKRKNQSHYCGTAPLSIDEYILKQPTEKQPYLQILDEALHEALPDAERRIAWSMPTYWRGQIIIQFACGKHNISLYVGEEIIEQFAKELRDYKTNKGTIYLPYQMPMPIQLITNIARRCGEANS